MSRRRAACAAFALLAVANSLHASSIARAGSLRNVQKAVIEGADGVSRAGDVNGDGVLDALVSRCANNDQAGSVYVLFGPFDEGERLSLADLGDRGFGINGAAPDDYACRSAAGGDVNGDGFDDVLVGAYRASNNGRSSSGTVYVIFGKEDTASVELAGFDQNVQGTKGFRIDGPYEGSLAGNDLAGLGDVNGDGLDDVAAAAPFAGTVYVVFGKEDPISIDLLTFEAGQPMGHGYKIRVGTPNRNTGLQVGAAGDANGDGATDVVVGYIPRLSSRGSAFVVFGKSDEADVDVQEVGFGGYLIEGTAGRSSTGQEVVGLGDLNGDDRSDVGIGAPYTHCCGIGRVYVVYGKKSAHPVRLDRLRDKGYMIKGARSNDGTGFAIDAAGDLDSDGRGDIVVGVAGASYGAPQAGAMYVIHGTASGGDVRLPDVRGRGYALNGSRKKDHIGGSVAGPGDVTSDGIPDLLTVAYRRDGVAYVVWGR